LISVNKIKKDMKKLLSLCATLLVVQIMHAQYFGRNKPRYRNFKFDVAKTAHFDIHNYLGNKAVLQQYADWSEQWYSMHQAVLGDTIKFKNPIILYNDHADFQQTNTLDGSISVGTGGVTEAFKNRVILPLAMSNQQTHHVLGHEMVHAFQYNMIINGDSTSLKNMQNLPLWMVEGLAEYMSIGRMDAHTSLWMRDAVLNNDIPSLKQLDDGYKYFPYRYGQAFWAYITGKYGDEKIRPLFLNTARYGMDLSLATNFLTTQKELSEDWKKTLTDYYTPFLRDKKEKPQGKVLIGEKNGGDMNISPVISPNGKYVVFLSEKNLFSLDLFLADAQTGKVIRTISSQVKDGHIDDYNNIESSGTWSPDSKEYAFVAVKKGKNVLVVKDVSTGKTTFESAIAGVPAFSQPAWSPKNRAVVVCGLVQGQVDLYEYDLKTKKAKQLTNDAYSEMHPYYFPDGQRLVFSSDQTSFQKGKNHGKWTFNLATLDLAGGKTEILDIFDTADNLNPVVDEKNNIFFVSDRDGFRNIYRFNAETQKVQQITDLLTGATGITIYSPCISIERSAARTRLVYSHYFKHKYTIYEANEPDFLNKEVDSKSVNFAPAYLPSVPNPEDRVNQSLASAGKITEGGATLKSDDYKSKFKLDYIGGSTGIGVSTGNNFNQGTGLAGGIQMLFSDMLGNHQLMSTLALNGEIADLGGQVTYINSAKRVTWGASLGRIPYRSGGYDYGGRDTLNFKTNTGTQKVPVEKYVLQVERFYDNQASFFLQFPFSVTKRFEAGSGYNFYSNRLDNYNDYVDRTGEIVYQDRQKLPSPDGYGFYNFYGAFVGDNSFMGVTSPISGWRYRIGAEQYSGKYNFSAVTADLRYYKYVKPFTFAVRAMHYGRFGQGAEQVYPMYVGQFYFMHGFNFNTVQKTFGSDYGEKLDRMVGNQIGVFNAEIRLPFTGPKRLSVISSRFLLTELFAFGDVGGAWRYYKDLFSDDKKLNPLPVGSFGAGIRLNVLGYMVIEPYIARPIAQGASGRWVFGFNFAPGW
jgi:hypothetical protein